VLLTCTEVAVQRDHHIGHENIDHGVHMTSFFDPEGVFLMRPGKLLVTLLATGLMVSPAWGGYNANLVGVVTEVSTYTDSNLILFRLSTQPASHPGCNKDYFALESAIPESRLGRLYARLLSAKATGETINIGYDNVGDCAHGYIRAHRIG
jgi:hypothetical protein